MWQCCMVVTKQRMGAVAPLPPSPTVTPLYLWIPYEPVVVGSNPAVSTPRLDRYNPTFYIVSMVSWCLTTGWVLQANHQLGLYYNLT